jgi:hypothetical protein
VLQFLIVLAILAVVVIVVTGPLRSASRSSAPGEPASAGDDVTRIADLEAAREAKYREIRDAELDHSTGKLSDADFEALERTLRAEAVEILHALDRARAPEH